MSNSSKERFAREGAKCLIWNQHSLGLYSEEDVVDDRKLREERLIANMEEQIKQVQGAKLEQLIININDIMENRIENNLKTLSKTVLVNLP